MTRDGIEFAAHFEPERVDALAWLDAERAQSGVTLADPARDTLVGWLVERLCGCAHTALARGPLEQFPVAQRLIAESIANWRRRVGALFVRLVRDANELGVRPTIASVTTHGERLQARRTTLGLELDGGRWFYRTKHLAMAAWFMDVCAALDVATPLHVRRILVRDGCSWDEHVATEPCRDADAVRRYFVRAGALVRLLERLAASDFHAQNVLAAGEYPVLADIETLFEPLAQGSVAAEALVCSPLRAGLVTATLVGTAGRRGIDVAGLHAGGALEMPFDHDGAPIVETLQPTIPAPIGDHVDDLLAGWDEMDACLGRVDLAPWLARAHALPRRDLRSSGAAYHAALFGSLATTLLRSEAARDRWLGSRGFTDEEQAALRGLEIPRPSVAVSDHPALAAAPPFTEVERNRRHDMIRTAIALRDDRPARQVACTVPPSRVATAVEIGDRILTVRFAGSQWHGVRWLPSSGVHRLDVLGGDLPTGNAGLAIVLALLARASGLARFAEASRGALESVPGGEPYVGACGLGGAIYALARCGVLLDDRALIAQAFNYLGAAPPTAAPWDVATGVAGLLLAANVLGSPPREAVDAVHAAYLQGLDAPLLPAPPAWLPQLATGVAYALRRCGRAASAPEPSASAWSEPTTLDQVSGDVLDDIDYAHAVYRTTKSAEAAAAIRAHADALVERRRETGHWFPATSIAERHQLSAFTGLPAVIHALLVAEEPSIFSLRRME